MEHGLSGKVHAGGSRPVSPRPPRLGEAASEVLTSTRRQLSELLELLSLEIRYSGLMLSSAAAMAVLTILAVFSVWALLIGAGIAVLISFDWSWAAALAAMALLNVTVMLLALWLMRRAIGRVGIDATRRVLGLEAGDDSE